MRDLIQTVVLAMAALAFMIAFTHNRSSLHKAGQTIEVKCDNPAGCSGLLEQVIATAPAGAVIQLGIGTFYERPLTINKSLTIKGVTPDKTFIQGMKSQASGQPPVVHAVFTIENDSEIQVLLKDLAIVTAAEEMRYALLLKGKANATLDHSMILNTEGFVGVVAGGMSFLTIRDSVITGGVGGIEVNDSAVLVLSNSRLFKGSVGLEVRGAGVAQLKNCAISRYQFGAIVSDSARARLENCKISEIHVAGLLAEDLAEFELSGSEIGDSLEYGIILSDSAKGRIARSFITNNVINGIAIAGSAVAAIQNSVIAYNGLARRCEQQDGNPDNICNGVVVRGSIQLVIDNSVIRDNADWGVAAFLKQCGYMEDDFTGKVIFSGENEIEGNNKSGNHSTMGNPGNHLFKDLPDGQVCLP